MINDWKRNLIDLVKDLVYIVVSTIYNDFLKLLQASTVSSWVSQLFLITTHIWHLWVHASIMASIEASIKLPSMFKISL